MTMKTLMTILKVLAVFLALVAAVAGTIILFSKEWPLALCNLILIWMAYPKAVEMVKEIME